MSANRIYLVCSHCREPEHALLLAERPDGNSTHEPPLRTSHMTAWFERHARCGKPDDFQLAFGRPQNWDVPELATKAASGVRLALATNGSGGEQ